MSAYNTSFAERLASSQNWPHKDPSSRLIAAAGVYYRPNSDYLDQVTCINCRKGWINFVPQDIENERLHSTKSPFLGLAYLSNSVGGFTRRKLPATAPTVPPTPSGLTFFPPYEGDFTSIACTTIACVTTATTVASKEEKAAKPAELPPNAPIFPLQWTSKSAPKLHEFQHFLLHQAPRILIRPNYQIASRAARSRASSRASKSRNAIRTTMATHPPRLFPYRQLQLQGIPRLLVGNPGTS